MRTSPPCARPGLRAHALAWGRRGRRLHAGGLHRERQELRRDLRRGRQALVQALPALAEARRIFLETDLGFMHVPPLALASRWIGDKRVTLPIPKYTKENVLFVELLEEVPGRDRPPLPAGGRGRGHEVRRDGAEGRERRPHRRQRTEVKASARRHQLLRHERQRRSGCRGEAGSTTCRPEFFLVVHITAFALGAGFAWVAFKRELTLLATAFSLFAAAELVYMTYHLDWTVFLFAHTIAEVLDLSAFVLVFAAAVYSSVRGRRSRRPGRDARTSPPDGRAARGRGGREQRAGGDDRVKMVKATGSSRRRSRSGPGRRSPGRTKTTSHTRSRSRPGDHKVEQGEASLMFDRPGTFEYVCTLHSRDMKGTVIVR